MVTKLNFSVSPGWAPTSSGCTYCGSTTQTSKIAFIVLCVVLVVILVYFVAFRALFSKIGDTERKPTEEAPVPNDTMSEKRV